MPTIKNKGMTKIKILGVIIVMLSVLTLGLSNRNLRQENAIATSNVEQLSVLLDEAESTFKVNDSISAKKIIALKLDVKQMENSTLIDKGLINDLHIKIKHISSYGHTETITTYNDTILLRDTVILLDSIPMAFRTFKETTEWHTIDGIILPNRVIIKSSNKEKLEYIEHWTKKKFLFIPYGKRRDSQIIISKNPKTEIIESVFISNTN